MGKDDSKKLLEQQLLLKVVENGGEASVCGGGNEGGATFILVFSIFIAICGSFVCGCALGYSSPVQSAIIGDLKLSIADYSLFGSMLTIGGLLGSLVCGKLTDYIGRRGTMWFSDLLYLTGWLAITFSKGRWSLDIGRLSVGCAMGLTVYVVPVYIAEIAPSNLRGGSVLLHQLMCCVGIALVYIFGLVINWRVLSLMAALPCIMQFFGLFFIPESPRWLVGHDKGYEATLRRLRGEKINIAQEAAQIKEYNETTGNISADNLFNVFKAKYAFSLVICLGLMALSAFGGTNGILFYAATIFESAGVSGSLGTITMALIQLPTTFWGVFLMDKCGRRPLLLFSVTGMGTACLCIALSFLMKHNGWMTGFSPFLALVGLLIYSATFPVGMGGIPFVIMSEIFPIHVKGAAGSLATIVNWSSSWIVSYTFNFMMEWSSSGTFFVFTGINVFAVLFVAKLVPETKGRTLEEIQESLTQTVY